MLVKTYRMKLNGHEARSQLMRAHIVLMRNIGIETLTHKVNIVFVALESGYCNRS